MVFTIVISVLRAIVMALNATEAGTWELTLEGFWGSTLLHAPWYFLGFLGEQLFNVCTDSCLCPARCSLLFVGLKSHIQTIGTISS